jgi:hypothetical protein
VPGARRFGPRGHWRIDESYSHRELQRRLRNVQTRDRQSGAATELARKTAKAVASGSHPASQSVELFGALLGQVLSDDVHGDEAVRDLWQERGLDVAALGLAGTTGRLPCPDILISSLRPMAGRRAHDSDSGRREVGSIAPDGIQAHCSCGR